MKQIDKVNENQTTVESCENSKKDLRVLDAKLVIKLFAVMSVMYGQKWSSQITDSGTMSLMRNVWAKHLYGLSGEDVARGLDECVKDYKSWPPTIGEFLDICIKARPHDLSRWNASGEKVVDSEGWFLDKDGNRTGVWKNGGI